MNLAQELVRTNYYTKCNHIVECNESGCVLQDLRRLVEVSTVVLNSLLFELQNIGAKSKGHLDKDGIFDVHDVNRARHYKVEQYLVLVN